MHYLLEPAPDYVKAAVTTVCELHREDVPGDVLVFLTGQEEVEAAVKLLRDEASRLQHSRLKYRLLPLPLYSGEGAARAAVGGPWLRQAPGPGLPPRRRPPPGGRVRSVACRRQGRRLLTHALPAHQYTPVRPARRPAAGCVRARRARDTQGRRVDQHRR